MPKLTQAQTREELRARGIYNEHELALRGGDGQWIDVNTQYLGRYPTALGMGLWSTERNPDSRGDQAPIICLPESGSYNHRDNYSSILRQLQERVGGAWEHSPFGRYAWMKRGVIARALTLPRKDA